MKGMGIILMVMGHAGCPLWLRDWIYLFHMPLFFFVTGYLFKENYVDEKRRYLYRRFQSCYVKFVKYGLLFLVFQNLFYHIGFGSYFDLRQFLSKAVMIVAFSGNQSLLGPYWFLIEMFFASILFLAVVCLYRGCDLRKFFGNDRSGYIACLLGALLIAFVISILPVRIPKISPKTFLAVSYMIAGLLIRKTDLNIHPVTGLICWVSLLPVLPFHVGSEEDNGMGVRGVHMFIYFSCSLVGVLGAMGIAGRVDGHTRRILSYIGANSFYVLTFHLACMVVAVNVPGLLAGIPFRIDRFPIHHTDIGMLWVPLTIIGLAGGLLFAMLINRLKYKMTR